MKTRLMALMLIAGGALFAETHVAVGVQFGMPVPAPMAVNAYRPPCPGPGYVWIDGYYDAYGNGQEGYWALPPYAGAYWVAPQFYGGQFSAGYWGGARGVYRPEPRFSAPAFNGGHGRSFGQPMPERREDGFRGRGNGSDRGSGRGGESRQGFRR